MQDDIILYKNNEEKSMVNQLIADMNNALDHNCYFAALALALVLPDVCAKAEYPNEKSNKKRYVDWFEEYIGQYEKCPQGDFDEESAPYLSGEVVYQLCCEFLHQGTPNIDAERIIAEENRIDHFTLVIESKKPFDIYSDVASVGWSITSTNKCRTYRVNVRRFCLIIAAVVKNFFSNNKEKFDFMNCSIIDWDEEVERMHQ